MRAECDTGTHILMCMPLTNNLLACFTLGVMPSATNVAGFFLRGFYLFGEYLDFGQSDDGYSSKGCCCQNRFPFSFRVVVSSTVSRPSRHSPCPVDLPVEQR